MFPGKIVSIVVAVTAAVLVLSACSTPESEARWALIKRSHEHYSGICPCPYSQDRKGRFCEDKSSYSRNGTAKVLCYGPDVPDEAVAEYMRLHPQKKSK